MKSRVVLFVSGLMFIGILINTSLFAASQTITTDAVTYDTQGNRVYACPHLKYPMLEQVGRPIRGLMCPLQTVRYIGLQFGAAAPIMKHTVLVDYSDGKQVVRIQGHSHQQQIQSLGLWPRMRVCMPSK